MVFTNIIQKKKKSSNKSQSLVPPPFLKQKNMPDCDICALPLNHGTRSRVPCFSCALAVCKDCVRTFLSQTEQLPSCMGCHAAFTLASASSATARRRLISTSGSRRPCRAYRHGNRRRLPVSASGSECQRAYYSSNLRGIPMATKCPWVRSWQSQHSLEQGVDNQWPHDRLLIPSPDRPPSPPSSRSHIQLGLRARPSASSRGCSI